LLASIVAVQLAPVVPPLPLLKPGTACTAGTKSEIDDASWVPEWFALLRSAAEAAAMAAE
jgi:hypothetical protein